MNKKILLALTLCAACAAEPASSPELGTTDQDMISLNGISLNGISLNGISLNGTSLTGQSITGVSVNGTSASGGALLGRSSTAAPWSGAAYVGSTWTATTSGNATVKLRVDAATQGTAANSDAWFYTVSFQNGSGWSPVCGVDASNKPIQAVAVAGVWGPVAGDATAYTASSTQFTLACRSKTIAKCVEMGYKTYAGLQPQLQACVRLLRADYCGNGTSYTVDGTTLNLYDNVGVQRDTQAWLPEAEWNADGAVCINRQNNPRWDLLAATDPSCAQSLLNAACGSKFSVGTLLIDELPPGAVP